jgi:O-methyltransferase
VFDSFRGVPPNAERHVDLRGRPMHFRAGAFRGRLREVQRTVARFGAPEVVEWRKGWFADTLPAFDGSVDVALVDVDLLASTRTCLAHLVPRLRRDGVLFSQDGHLRATVDLLGDARFWRDDVGVAPPVVLGLGTTKLVELLPAAPAGAGRMRGTPGGP